MRNSVLMTPDEQQYGRVDIQQQLHFEKESFATLWWSSHPLAQLLADLDACFIKVEIILHVTALQAITFYLQHQHWANQLQHTDGHQIQEAGWQCYQLCVRTKQYWKVCLCDSRWQLCDWIARYLQKKSLVRVMSAFDWANLQLLEFRQLQNSFRNCFDIVVRQLQNLEIDQTDKIVCIQLFDSILGKRQLRERSQLRTQLWQRADLHVLPTTTTTLSWSCHTVAGLESVGQMAHWTDGYWD